MSMSQPTPSPSASFFGVSFVTIIEIVVIGLIAIALERIVTRYIGHFTKRANFEPNVANNLALLFRILVLIGAVVSISRVSGLNSDWLLSVSAIGAAAVGFASQKTIGNFIAGIFLISARPFKVGNYVRIGTIEGIVTEITINYTKIITPSNNIVSISNLQILDRDITNFLYETNKSKNLYCYTFEIGFDHSVPSDKITEIFNTVFEKYSKNQNLPRKLTYSFNRSTNVDRIYLIYLYVNKPEEIFTLKPEIAEEVFSLWDIERLKLKRASNNPNPNLN
jgi:small-conductance mechanosensitive channel